MKKRFLKIYLLLVFIGFVFSSCQETEFKELSTNSTNLEVSYDLAKQVANNFISSGEFTKSPSEDKNGSISSKKIKKIIPIKCSDGRPAMFVMQLDPAGFVIIAGFRKEFPILAFSENKKFVENDNAISNIGLFEWIEERKQRINYLRSLGDSAVSDSITELWDYLAPPDGGDDEIIISGGTVYEEVGPLTSTEWSQKDVFNEQLPDLGCTDPSNGKALAGCVSIATAQIMKKWENPSSYQWNLMSDQLATYYTCCLIRDIGEEVDMDYGCDGSGTPTIKAMYALANAFDYNDNMQYLSLNTSTVVNQLNIGWPVILRADAGDGTDGHAWVCDGYRRNKHITIHNPGTPYEYETTLISDFYFRMNWGWGGDYNAWYLVNDFTPGIFDLRYNRKMIINIHPL